MELFEFQSLKYIICLPWLPNIDLLNEQILLKNYLRIQYRNLHQRTDDGYEN